MYGFKVLGLAAVLALASAAASAEILSTDYSFSAVFTSGPYASLDGAFRLSLDDVTQTRTLQAIDFSIGTQTYDLGNSGVGGLPNGGFSVGGPIGRFNTFTIGTNDFGLSFSPADGSQPHFFYTTADSGAVVFASQVNLTSQSVAASGAVPEPVTWAIMMLGFGGVGALMRRCRTVATTRTDQLKEPNSESIPS